MKKAGLLIIGSMIVSLSHTSDAATYTRHVKKAPSIGKTKASRLLNMSHPVKKSPPPLPKHKDKLHGQMNLATNYIFRGISQTNNYPAMQGGASYRLLQNGLYIAAWGSNASFVDEFEHTTFIELDPGVGVSKEINKHANYDASITYYAYPGSSTSNYPELNVYVNYYWITTHFGYSNDIYASGKSGTYYNAGINYVIPSPYFFHVDDVRLIAAVGYSALPKHVGLRGYEDYIVSLSKVINHFTCGIQWTNTSGSIIDRSDLAGNLFAFTIGRSF